MQRNKKWNAKQRWLRFMVWQEVRVLSCELSMNRNQVFALSIVIDAPLVFTRRWNWNVVIIVDRIDVVITSRASVEFCVIYWRCACWQIVRRLWEKICCGNCFHAVVSSGCVHKRRHRTCAEDLDWMLEVEERKLFVFVSMEWRWKSNLITHYLSF